MQAIVFEGRVIGVAHESYIPPSGSQAVPLENGATEADLPDLVFDGKVVRVGPAPPTTQLSVLEFRQRFTLAEKAAIELAAIDTPTAPTEQRQQAAMLRAMLADQACAEFIDLTDPRVIEGMQLLVQAGVLTEPRSIEVLTP